MKKLFTKGLSLTLALLMIITVLPMQAFASSSVADPWVAQSDATFKDNVFLDALAYLGYGTSRFTVNNEYGSNVARTYRTDIGYSASGAYGTETTSAGKPNVSTFENNGLCCASYAAYVYFNYLPNVYGFDTSALTRPSNCRSTSSWYTACEKWVSNGVARKTVINADTNETSKLATLKNLPIGSLLVFTDGNGNFSHTGIYAGYRTSGNTTRYFQTQVGGSRGPEVQIINGFYYVDSNDQSVYQTLYAAYTPEIHIPAFGYVGVKKVDDTGNPVPNAKIGVYTNPSCTNKKAELTTNSSGLAVYDGELEEGTVVYFKEISAPEGYDLSTQVVSATVVANKTTYASVSIVDNRQGWIRIQKCDDSNTILGEGYEFSVYSDKACTKKVDTITTNANGYCASDYLTAGTYYVKETKLPSTDKIHKLNSTVYAVNVPKGTYVYVTCGQWNNWFSNDLMRGTATVIKTSDDGVIEGVPFRLFGTSDSGTAVDMTVNTNAEGKAIFNNVLIGTYTVEEVNPDGKYLSPESKTITVKADETATVSFHNTLKKFTLSVTKTDIETGTAQGDATLESALYGIYNGNELIDTYTTDKNGQFTTKEYVCGDNWTLREIEASEGYLLDETIHHIGAEPRNFELELNTISLNVTEKVIKSKISITKLAVQDENDNGVPETGAEFEITRKSSGKLVQTLVIGADGTATTDNLPYGVYTVHQTKGWEGYQLVSDFDVFIDENGKTYSYVLKNFVYKAYLQVTKQDAETGKTIPCSSTGFQIFDSKNKLVTYETIDTFYTDENGVLITPMELPYGSYTLVEKDAPYGYILDPTPIAFEINPSKFVNENGIQVVKVVKKNYAQKGTITINKYGEVFSSVTEDNGIYQPQYEVQALANATYTVTAVEDIITPDGTLRYAKGTVVATLTTDNNGKATTTELYLGKYEIKEITAPYGYVLNSEPIIVELTYAGQNIEVTNKSADFNNKRQKIDINLIKALERDDLFGLGMNNEILSVKFGLYAAEEITAKDGTVIPADALIEIATCNENGSIQFTTDIPVGANLYIREYATDNHYLVSNEIYSVVFEYAGQDTETVTITLNDGEKIENKLIRSTIVGRKIDEDGFAIANTLFGLFRSDETEFTEETALMLSTSNEIGIFGFEDVPYGDYIIRELKSAPAFVLNSENYAVTVNTDNQIIELTIENRFIVGSVIVPKVDKLFPDIYLSGAVFEVYVDVNNDKVFNADIDILVGELTETDTGIYRMDGLRYNGYFLYEKSAPAGYEKDNAYYYFEIREDGIEVVVENEIGVGFVNVPIPAPEIPKTDNDAVDMVVDLYLGGTAVIILSSAVLIKKRKRKENEA